MAGQDIQTKEVLTTGEVAKICNVTIRTVIKWFEAGKLKGYKIPASKDRRIPRTELIKFMNEHGMPTEKLESDLVKRVLIADDERGIVELLEEELKKDRYLDVQCAYSGWEAGMALADFKPHLIILDYNLGDMSGDKVIEMIRKNAALSSCKILVVSGFLTPEQGEKMIESGADDFIRKPFGFDLIRPRIDALLGLDSARR